MSWTEARPAQSPSGTLLQDKLRRGSVERELTSHLVQLKTRARTALVGLAPSPLGPSSSTGSARVGLGMAPRR